MPDPRLEPLIQSRFREGWDCYGVVKVLGNTYHVRLNYGCWPFRAVLEVWQDVWPAIGGLMGRKKFRSNEEARACFDETIDMIRAEGRIGPSEDEPFLGAV